jgi:DNA repair exonuclease SbcCD ATPase subunit
MIKTSAHPYWNSIRVRADQQREINDQLIRLRNAAQRINRNQSGFPPGFREFCIKHLATMTRDSDYVKKQVLTLVHSLQEQMSKLQVEREQLDQAFLIRLEQVSSQVDELLSALPEDERESRDVLPVVVTEP